MSEWVDTQLGQVADVQTGPFGSMLHQRDYVDVGTPLITVKNLGNNRITLNKIDHVSDYDVKRLSKFILKEGDIVFSRVGYVDRRAYITCKEAGWLFSGSTLRIRVTDFSIINPKFLSYYFGQKSVKETIKNLSVGATRPSLNTKLLEDLDICVPPLPEQHAIAIILSSLDDKIELLHRQNETLEALAQTLFRQWFIEEMKEGWIEGPLSDYCDVIDCLHSKKPEKIEPEENSKFLLQVYNISQQGCIDLTKKYYVSDEDYYEWVRRIELSSGDLIISKTGRVGAIAQIPYYLKTGIGRNLVAIHPKKPFTCEYLKDLMLSKWMRRNIFLKTSDGTILQSLHVKSISALPVIFPGERCVKQYSEMIRPIHRKIMENLKSIDVVNDLRDTLLPKLMSGEVRVR